MEAVQLNQPVPHFSLPGTHGAFQLGDYAGKYLVLYFYPMDNTPGCTTEGRDFRDLYPKFQQANAAVFGISKDSLESHEKFRCKQEFPFALLSDKEKAATGLFAVHNRSTFVIDPEGKLIKEWRGVKVSGHAQEVLDFICAQSKN